jgi:hypothetical protein
VLAALENIIPPVPADTAVALGAFLAGRGTLNAWAVFGITWERTSGRPPQSIGWPAATDARSSPAASVAH